MKKFFKFFTNTVFLFFACGSILIIIGHSQWMTSVLPVMFPVTSPIHPIIKSIGGALIGSGVFTVIIKSSEYSEVFSNIIGEMIWSKKFIEKRSDKKEMWSMISKIIYEEKFPQISNEIEDIITTQYFPTSHDYYLENYNITVNIEELNQDFAIHHEVLTTTVKPTTKNTKIPISFNTSIDLPDIPIAADLTECSIEEMFINGIIQNTSLTTSNDSKYNFYKLELELEHSESYQLVLKRKKVLYKKTNPDKCFIAKTIIRNMRIEIISDAGINIAFYKMGTVSKFNCSDIQVNNGVKVSNWEYDGLILPHQGYIIVLK